MRGALATLDKWCRGSGSGPAFPLKAKVFVKSPSENFLEQHTLLSLHQGPSPPAHSDVSRGDQLLLTLSIPRAGSHLPQTEKSPSAPHFAVWQFHALTGEQTDNQAHDNDRGGVVCTVP